jgi:hypothetical protein
MKSIFIVGLLLCFAASTLNTAGQAISQHLISISQDPNRSDAKATSISDNNPVEVKTDRFSNVTTVTLKPQLIIDKTDHMMTIEISAKFGEKTFSDWERDRIKGFAVLESQSKEAVDFGDQELHFIINGKPLNLGKTDIKIDPYSSLGGKLKPGFSIRQSGLRLLDQNALGLFSKADQVEMRLGSIELTLSKEATTNLREYAIQALAQHKIAKEKGR